MKIASSTEVAFPVSYFDTTTLAVRTAAPLTVRVWYLRKQANAQQRRNYRREKRRAGLLREATK